MNELPLFNFHASQAARDAGIEQATSYPFDEPVARARNIAILLAKRNGTVCADDVHKYLSEWLPDVLEAIQPKAWGGVMKSPRLRFTGRIKESERLARHAGAQRIWELA